MASSIEIMEAVQLHLRTNGLTRNPTASDAATAPYAGRPVCNRDPMKGLQSPSDEETPSAYNASLLLHLVPATGQPTRPYEGFLQRDFLEFVYYGTNTPDIFDLEDAVARLLDDRRGFTIAGLRIEECMRFRKLSRLRSDESGYLYASEYQFTYVRSGP